MAVPFSNTKLRVPRGFQNLLEGLAREVLRSQPEELYEFGAQYFENLIKQRDESGIDPTEQGAKMEDRFYNNKAFSQPEIDPSDPNQQDAALAIQTKFRQHAAKQEVEVIREEKAATKIQAGFRGHQGRTGEQDEPVEKVEEEQVSKAAEEEVDIDLTDPDVEAAAVKIQASFKGYQARKTLAPEKEATIPQDTTQAATEPDNEIDIDLNDPEVEKAAVKIQAGFKGMRARQEVRSMKEPEETEESDYKKRAPKMDKMPVMVEMREEKVVLAVLETTETTVDMCGAPEPERTLQMSSAPEPEEEEGEYEGLPPTMDKMPLMVEMREEKVELAVLETTETTAMCSAPEPEKAPQMRSAPEPEVLTLEEEEVDIDLNDPEVEQAALKIQAGFKGMQARREVKQIREDIDDKKTAISNQPMREPAAEEIDIDLNDPEVESAALKIQAGFKGMKTRQELKNRTPAQKGSGKSSVVETSKTPDNTKDESVAEPTDEKTVTPKPAEEEVDIDLDDPEVHAAAVKIQAGFKGHKTRQQLSAKRSTQQTPTDVEAKTDEVKPTEGEEPQSETAAEADVSEQAPAEADVAEQAPAEAEPTDEKPTEPAPAEDTPAVETAEVPEKAASPVAATSEDAPAAPEEPAAPAGEPEVPAELEKTEEEQTVEEPTAEEPTAEQKPVAEPVGEQPVTEKAAEPTETAEAAKEESAEQAAVADNEPPAE